LGEWGLGNGGTCKGVRTHGGQEKAVFDRRYLKAPKEENGLGEEGLKGGKSTRKGTGRADPGLTNEQNEGKKVHIGERRGGKKTQVFTG